MENLVIEATKDRLSSEKKQEVEDLYQEFLTQPEKINPLFRATLDYDLLEAALYLYGRYELLLPLDYFYSKPFSSQEESFPTKGEKTRPYVQLSCEKEDLQETIQEDLQEGKRIAPAYFDYLRRYSRWDYKQRGYFFNPKYYHLLESLLYQILNS